MAGILAAAFSYVAALMGAGFASGQEIVTFFVIFGKFGIIGIVISALLIGLFGALISEYAMRLDIGYSEMISMSFPQRIVRYVKILTFIYSISVTAVMLACFGELGAMLYGMPNIVGAMIMVFICGFMMLKGNGTALKLNGIIGGILFIATISVCLYLLGYREHQTFGGGGDAVVSGAVYAGYNLISVGTVLASGRVFLRRRNDGILCGVASGLMIFVLLILMWGIMSIYYGKINLGELPMITLTLRESNTLAKVYALVIAGAVLTTALSSVMCATDYIEERAGSKKAVIIVLMLSFAFSGAGFSRLIDTLYRYCGYAGIIAVIIVTTRGINKAINGEKRRK